MNNQKLNVQSYYLMEYITRHIDFFIKPLTEYDPRKICEVRELLQFDDNTVTLGPAILLDSMTGNIVEFNESEKTSVFPINVINHQVSDRTQNLIKNYKDHREFIIDGSIL